MAWIRVVEPENATGEVLAVYQKITGKTKPDSVGNILKVNSLKPRILEALWDLDRAVRMAPNEGD
jgi:hypothetical protein